jgi:hypothetical protein
MRLRVPAHRCSTANLRAAYPFVSAGSLGGNGVYIGRDRLGGSFSYDPWELYPDRRRGYAGVLTGPNMLVAGKLGKRKSSLVKTYGWRQHTFGRKLAILDPKGEYGPLAAAVGAESIKVAPGRGVRLNPLDPGPGAAELGEREVRRRQLVLLQSLASASLGRGLNSEERTACDLSLKAVNQGADKVATMVEVVDALLSPTTAMAGSVHTTASKLAQASREVALELRRLCEGDLQGMFDGPTNVDVDWDGPAVVLDLSEVFNSEALGLLMTCASSWLQSAIARPTGGQRIVIVEEAWAVLANLGVARWLQALAKLARQWGVQLVIVIHRLGDLLAAGDEGSQQMRLAQGLLADTETRVIYAQPSDEIGRAVELLGLSETEAQLLPNLEPSAALWKVGPHHTHLVDHQVGDDEWDIIDTDERMRTAAGAPVAGEAA